MRLSDSDRPRRLLRRRRPAPPRALSRISTPAPADTSPSHSLALLLRAPSLAKTGALPPCTSSVLLVVLIFAVVDAAVGILVDACPAHPHPHPPPLPRQPRLSSRPTRPPPRLSHCPPPLIHAPHLQSLPLAHPPPSLRLRSPPRAPNAAPSLSRPATLPLHPAPDPSRLPVCPGLCAASPLLRPAVSTPPRHASRPMMHDEARRSLARPESLAAVCQAGSRRMSRRSGAVHPWPHRPCARSRPQPSHQNVCRIQRTPHVTIQLLC